MLRPEHEPRATDFVPQMQSMISRLEARGLAYLAGNRDVCYSVRKFEGYGRLSGKSLDDLRAGSGSTSPPTSRIRSISSSGSMPARTSPRSQVVLTMGAGRPGWHIECSAMSSGCSVPISISTAAGGTCSFPTMRTRLPKAGANGCTFRNYWMHNGFVRVDNEKMSKSLGTFFTIRDVLKRFDAEVLRFHCARTLRSPLNYSDAHP